MKQNLIEMKGERESSTIIVGEFNTPVSIMVGRTDKIIKETEDSNNTINQLNLTDICRNSAQQQQNTYFSQIHMEHPPG